MGYDPTGHWDWGTFGKVVATTAVVALCLTGVGCIAAAAATAAAASVTAAVTTTVAAAGISTAFSAIDGAICAEESGGNWYDGAMAGAMGGSVGALVSSASGLMRGVDAPFRMDTLGRAASSCVYDLTYELFDEGTISPQSYATCSQDVLMDVTLSPVYYHYSGAVSNSYVRSAINGFWDAIIDVFQTNVYFS